MNDDDNKAWHNCDESAPNDDSEEQSTTSDGACTHSAVFFPIHQSIIYSLLDHCFFMDIQCDIARHMNWQCGLPIPEGLGIGTAVEVTGSRVEGAVRVWCGRGGWYQSGRPGEAKIPPEITSDRTDPRSIDTHRLSVLDKGGLNPGMPFVYTARMVYRLELVKTRQRRRRIHQMTFVHVMR